MYKKVISIFSHKELAIKLALKDLRVRYRRPLLGVLWSFLTPLCLVIIFQIVFSKILRVPVQKYPFFIYLMTAVFPWRFFQVSISRAVTSILDNKSLVKDAYFPRELLPISVVLAELINFLPFLFVMFIFLFLSKIGFSLALLYLPLIILLHTILIIGFSLLVSSLHVKWRDTGFIVEISLTALFYLTPIFYPLNLVAQNFSKIFLNIYLLNPFVGIVNLYRISFLKGFTSTLPLEVGILNTLISPIMWAIVFLFIGFYIFSKNEDRFYDYLQI